MNEEVKEVLKERSKKRNTLIFRVAIVLLLLVNIYLSMGSFVVTQQNKGEISTNQHFIREILSNQVGEEL